MTTFFSEEVQCPVCNEKLKVEHLGSTNTFGGQDTDFRSHAAGFDPLHIVIAMCEHCGYSDFSHSFAQQQFSEAEKQAIRSVVELSGEKTIPSSLKYRNAARIAIIMSEKSELIANLYLRAAWSAADEKKPEGEIESRKLAIDYFQKALEKKEIPQGNEAVIQYLIGELYRRIGDSAKAREYFDSVLAYANLDAKLNWLKPVAEQQRDNPQDRFERR